MASVEGEIQAAVVGLLEEAEEDLRIDDREVHVWSRFPEHSFKQRDLPIVVVERPMQRAKEAFANVVEREEYASTVWLVDSMKPTEVGMEEARERLDLLRGKVEAALWETPYLGLEEYGVMPGFWSYARAGAEVETLGNNLMRQRCELVVPVLIEARG